MRDVTEILVHWDAGRSQSEIADSLGLDRKTVKKYLTPAIEAGIEPGSGRSQEEWSTLVREWFPHLADTTLRQYSWPLIEPHRDYIVAQLEQGVTKATIHQRLRDERGLEASVASLKRWIAANLPEQALRAKVTVLGEDPPPGQEAQIDYGYLGMWADPLGARRRRVWGFVMVLSCSRHLFLRPVLRMDQATWTECHLEAFAFFDGAPARLVPDNLKTGVIKADLYDPTAQPVLCRARRPLRGADRPGPGGQAEGQATRGTADAVLPRLVLPRPRVRLDRGDAAGRPGLVTQRGRAALVPAAGAAPRR